MNHASLSIVVPVFNEERRLPRLLEIVRRDGDEIVAAAGFRLVELIVVDAASTDSTAALLAASDDVGGRLMRLRLEGSRGKGAAVRAGVLAARSPFVLMTDVDLSTPLADLEQLALALGDDGDVAIGSRALAASRVLGRQPAYRELMGKTFNVGVRLLTGLPWRDTQCGFKLFRRATTRRLFELQRVDGFAFDVELLVLARRLGLRVSEVPVRWVNDPDTRVGLMTSSAEMARDALRIAYRARRPLPPG